MSKRGTFWVLESDWGGQVLMSVPAETVKTELLRAALIIVDAVDWTCNDGDGCSLFQEVGRPGGAIFGGMGGGIFPRGRIWIHKNLNSGSRAWVEKFLFDGADLPTVEKLVEWLAEEDCAFQYHHYTAAQLQQIAQAALSSALGCMHD